MEPIFLLIDITSEEKFVLAYNIIHGVEYGFTEICLNFPKVKGF